MIALKKIVSILVCAALLISVFGFCLVASADSKDKAVISTIDATGTPGDTIYVPVKIENNPGFSDLAFSLSFNKSLLSYQSVSSGSLEGFSIFDHSKSGKVVVSYTGDFTIGNDSTLLYFIFNVKKKAKAKTGKLKISGVYLKNSKSKSIKYSIDSGSIKISKPCEDEHSYSDWEYIIPATCTQEGVRTCHCTKCGSTRSETSPAQGHIIDDRFSVDVVAEGSKPGMLSRHCSKCGAKTNIVIYTEENATALAINKMLDSLSENSISNLIYFLNGEKTYPEINYDVTDVDKFILENSSFEDDENYKSARNDDGSINVGIAIDKVLNNFLGKNNKAGILTTIKRAAIAGEFPFRAVGKLICLIFF